MTTNSQGTGMTQFQHQDMANSRQGPDSKDDFSKDANMVILPSKKYMNQQILKRQKGRKLVNPSSIYTRQNLKFTSQSRALFQQSEFNKINFTFNKSLELVFGKTEFKRMKAKIRELRRQTALLDKAKVKMGESTERKIQQFSK